MKYQFEDSVCARHTQADDRRILPILRVSADAGDLFERSKLSEASANRRQSKMGEVDVSAVVVWHRHHSQIVSLHCAI